MASVQQRSRTELNLLPTWLAMSVGGEKRRRGEECESCVSHKRNCSGYTESGRNRRKMHLLMFSHVDAGAVALPANCGQESGEAKKISMGCNWDAPRSTPFSKTRLHTLGCKIFERNLVRFPNFQAPLLEISKSHSRLSSLLVLTAVQRQNQAAAKISRICLFLPLQHQSKTNLNNGIFSSNYSFLLFS